MPGDESPGSDDQPASPDRYDLVLAAIPAALVGGVTVGAAGPLSTQGGLVAGTLVAVGAVGYGLFSEPPS
ncbi:hypothetical protein ACFQH6_17675 [Halobacteriaceae archaeon GCM10025711]